MGTLLLINSLLIGLVSLVALTIMIYWHLVSGGAWRRYSAGRSLMGLLTIIFAITGNAAVQTLIPVPLMVKVPFYFSLYLIFAWALAQIGLSIRREALRGKSRLAHPSTHTRKENDHV